MDSKVISQNTKIGILFDLDGVLIDSETGYSEIWRVINKEFPTGIDNLEIVIKGCTLEKILSDYFPSKETAMKVTKRLYELESQMTYNYKSGAKELLDSIKTRELPIVLVTSSNSDKMKHLFSQLPELRGYFNHIITSELIQNSKPNPEGYLLGASNINCDPNKCIVFEDSLQGVKAGKNAGAFVVGVAGTLEETILFPYSDIVISNLEEIVLDQLISKVINHE